MTHLPYVAAAYVLAILIPATLGASAWLRMRTAQRRLASMDRRRKR